MSDLTEEQTILKDAARGWVEERMPVVALRRLRATPTAAGFDPVLWREMAEMGWAGIIVPETFGGADFGYRSFGLVLEELGRTLAASPLLASALIAVTAFRLGGSDAQQARWLPAISAGESVATVAVDEGPHHAPDCVALSARRSDGGWILDGRKYWVVDGPGADLLIVAARTGGAPGDRHGLSLFVVPATTAGIIVERLETVDCRAAAHLHLSDVRLGDEALLGRVDEGWTVLDRTLDAARAGLAAEMLGSATAGFEMVLDYLKTRVQFGRPIGTFQALQHRAALMFVELELTRSSVEAALAALDAEAEEVATLCSLAKATASQTFHLVSSEMIQMHGGIGMTEEHDAGFYLKRARVAETLFGGAGFHRARYAALMGY